MQTKSLLATSLLFVTLLLPACAIAPPSVASSCPVLPVPPAPVPLGSNLQDLMQSFLLGTLPSLESFNSSSAPAKLVKP